ncbi:hypothetical protein N7508_011041 [Penicillium antarcticum]|uniref:uncharacterized protein n=1 Tax=Penicillium antarcticum TaxID=416450 RepID=UPI00238AD66C|nr:uncharacterized protein N7508_011041 [Penicillium antarcticum]KAJ5288266.1 hypothetical protein N7508_011041 [Penicillium antarcticum]
MTLTSNEKRALSRQQCREALAAHIHERLGLTVAPSRVRLQPSAADGYAWSVSDSQKHLLKTNLSNGTVGFYQDIRDALVCEMEAVSPQTLRELDTGFDKKMSAKRPCPPKLSKSRETASGGGSFTVTIQRLENANKELAAELVRAKACSEDLLKEKLEWEVKYREIDGELDASRRLVNHLESELVRVGMGVTEAMKILQDHQLPEGSQSYVQEEK